MEPSGMGARHDLMEDIKPFGFMSEMFEQRAKGGPPGAWNRAASFEPWIAQTAGDIGRHLWPEWDGQRWRGDSTGQPARDLTLADLALMRALAARIVDDPGADQQRRWFTEEDDLFLHDRYWAGRFGADATFRTVSPSKLGSSFEQSGRSTYSASLTSRLKRRLQRPRPHQAAWWLGQPAPRLEAARSAWSPSAVSGHAYQGLAAAMGCYLANRQALEEDASQVVALQQVGVGIGDRRVFAGVHYPSDNVMSWFSLFSAIPHMADSPAAQRLMTDFVAGAISGSVVFAALKTSGGHARCRALLQPWVS